MNLNNDEVFCDLINTDKQYYNISSFLFYKLKFVGKTVMYF